MRVDQITPYALLWELCRKRGWRLRVETEQHGPAEQSRLARLVLRRPGKTELVLDLGLYAGRLDAAAEVAFELLKDEGVFSPRAFGGGLA